MSAIMHFRIGITMVCFILFVMHTVYGYGLIGDDCPKACECDQQQEVVTCKNEFWTRLPDVPEGTKTFRMTPQRGIVSGITGMLQRPIICKGYNQLIDLDVQASGITSIAEDIFECMPELVYFRIVTHKLHQVPKSTLKFPPNLQSVKNLIIIKLESVVLQPKSLNCLVSLKHLSRVDISGNSFRGHLAHILKPLKNVLLYLSIASCNIAKITVDTFAGFKLEILDLSGNPLHHVPRNAFTNMRNLKELHLSETSISQPGTCLKDLPLKVLFFDGNGLSEPPPIAASVQKLYLGGNNFYNLAAGSIAHYSGLRNLHIDISNITNIERNAFYNLPKLKELHLEENKIRGKSLINLFLALLHTPIEDLFLKGNPIGSIDSALQVFTPNQLQTLFIQNCLIEDVNPGTFKHLKHIRILDLSSNKLYRLSPNTFHDITELSILYLDKNRLREFDGQSVGLQNSPLLKLHLASNGLRAISVSNLSTLTEIDLAENELSRIERKFFENVSLSRLDLSVNKIFSADQYLPFETSNLTYLDISENFFPSCSWTMKNVKTLWMSEVPIGNWHQDDQQGMWRHSYNLRELKISGCQFMNLIPNMFSTLNKLLLLDASSNFIPFIEPRAFFNLSNLEYLTLDHNLITNINWETFQYAHNLRFLSLSHNPLLCTCEILWVSQAVTTNDLVYFTDEYDLRCQGPGAVQNVKVKDLALKLRDCENKRFKVVLIPTGASLGGFLLILIVYIAWHYRWRIRYMFFLAKAGLGRYEEMNDDQEYVYDAFVAYSGRDLPWVREHLLQNLDVCSIGPEGFKFCVHDRDWLVGVAIAENIVKSIVESRRTIVVLSKEFAKSHWCRFELATAHMRLNAEGRIRDRLLIILVEDIPAELLTAELSHILTSKTYITWPKEPELQGAFWKVLHKSLRRGLLYK